MDFLCKKDIMSDIMAIIEPPNFCRTYVERYDEK